MPSTSRRAYAFNRTRQSFLATELSIADTHWSRMKGLLGMSASQFIFGKGLWIVPCCGIHTLAMRCPIDVLYLDSAGVVVYCEENMKPWRFAPVRLDTRTVIELPPHSLWSTETKVGDQIEIVYNFRDGKAAEGDSAA